VTKGSQSKRYLNDTHVVDQLIVANDFIPRASDPSKAKCGYNRIRVMYVDSPIFLATTDEFARFATLCSALMLDEYNF